MKRNNAGVTMIEMVTVIIILFILAIIAVYGTSSTVRKAEFLSLYEEFRAVYVGSTEIKTEYEEGIIDEYEEGKQYCEKYSGDGTIWYTIYGLDNESYYKDKSYTMDDVLESYGLSELKRSYDISFDNGIQVKYADGKSVSAYSSNVRSYDDIKAVKESEAF